MLLFFLVLLSFILLNIKCLSYDYESVEENIQKSSLIIDDKSPYKIFEYIPFCGENKNNKKNIFINFYKSGPLSIYVYDNFSNIAQDFKGRFINYNITEFIYKNKAIMKLNDLICKKKYYIVLLNGGYYISDYHFTIINEINDIIQLNPSLSQDYSFFQTSKENMKFFYEYKENKLVSITLKGEINLTIFENDSILYKEINENVNLIKFIFKKNTKYNIIFEDLTNIGYDAESKPSIDFNFFEENDYIKPNFNHSSFVLNSYLEKDECFIEIDISKYKINENILFLLFNTQETFVKYQYKKELLVEKNFINKGFFQGSGAFNYFLIKKEKDYNNLILYVKSSLIKLDDDDYISLYLVKYKVEDINSDGIIALNEPKVLFIDYYNFNQYNSFAIYSNYNFLFSEQIINDEVARIDKEKFGNLLIYKDEIENFYYKKKALVFIFEDIPLNDYIFIEFKKFDYTIIKCYNDFKMPSIEYLNSNKGDTYYYYLNIGIFDLNVFFPIYGNYEAYFIDESDIKNLTDFDFNKQIKLDNFYFRYTFGYLKIKIKSEFSMIQHIYLMDHEYNSNLELDTGKYYLIDISQIIANKIQITFKSKYIKKILALKCRIINGNSNYNNISLIMDGTKYIVNNNALEINYFYKEYKSQLINLLENNIKDKTFLEIKVGFLSDDLKFYKTIDLKDVIGKLSYNDYNGAIIKIPRDMNEDLYNYAIIFPEKSKNSIQITYDTQRFAVPNDILECYSIFPFVELFKDNPYKYLNESDKNYYITITGGTEIFIKKSIVYNEIKYNQLNILRENETFYYKIEFPKGDYNYVLVQTDVEQYDCYNYISSNNYFYNEIISYFIQKYYVRYLNNYSHHFFINIYYTNSISYINIVPRKEYYFTRSLDLIKVQHNIAQIGESKIRINITSYAYYDYPNKYIYYVLFNIPHNYHQSEFEIISGKKKANESSYEKMIIIEDDGTNESIIQEEVIDTQLYEGGNNYFIIPVDKNNNLINFKVDIKGYFSYHNKPKQPNQQNSESSSYIYYIIGGTLFGIIILVIFIVLMIKKKHNKMNKINEDLMSYNINDIDKDNDN